MSNWGLNIERVTAQTLTDSTIVTNPKVAGSQEVRHDLWITSDG